MSISGSHQRAVFPMPATMRDGLALYQVGTGDPLLFMPYPHGLSTLGDGSPNLVAIHHHLASVGHRVVSFDPPGAGKSTRPATLTMSEMLDCAEETLSALDITGPVDVAGHSQGGVAALAFALEHPDRVRRLLLLNTSSGGPAFLRARGAIWNRTHPDFWRFAMRAMLFMLVRRRGPEIWMNNLIFRDSYRDRSFYEPEPVTWRDWLRPPRPRSGWGSKVAWRIDYRTRLGEVSAPTLVTGGRFDPQMPPDCAEELAHGIRGAEMVIFQRSGHYPFVEELDAFWSAVEQFLVNATNKPTNPSWIDPGALDKQGEMEDH